MVCAKSRRRAGLVMAQDPTSARFHGHAAAASLAVDLTSAASHGAGRSAHGAWPPVERERAPEAKPKGAKC